LKPISPANVLRRAALSLGAKARRNPMRILRHLRRQIERLPPYPALVLIAVPLAVAEPLKLATLFIVGKGHWIAGVVAMICAYAVSLFVTERLFQIVKPKLLTLRWFKTLWTWFIAARDKAFDYFRRPAHSR
jgi:hypothetical protein